MDVKSWLGFTDHNEIWGEINETYWFYQKSVATQLSKMGELV